MVGFTLLSRSYYYLRRRSPGPPFPPDHRQAGERGAIPLYTFTNSSRCGSLPRLLPQRAPPAVEQRKGATTARPLALVCVCGHELLHG